MLAGIANILASLAGFLFGSILVVAAAVLALRKYRPAAAVSGAIIMAVSMFIGLRTVVDLMVPPPIYPPLQGIYGPAVAFLMSPSPIFTLFNGAAELQYASPGQPLWWVDIGSNLAALIFNSLGLGFSVLGWTQLLQVERKVPDASQNE